MSATPVPFAPDTLETIRRAFRFAADRRHDLVTLEHLLRALVDDPKGRAALQSLNVDLSQLTHDLDDVLLRAHTPVPGIEAGEARIHRGLRPRGRARRRARRLVERAGGGQRQPARVPAAGGRLARRLLPHASGREPSAPAAGRGPQPLGRHARRAHAGRRRRRVEGPAARLCVGTGGEGPPGPDRPAHRPAARTRSRHPGAVPAAQEQPAARGRAGRGQDRAGRRPGPAHRRAAGAAGAGRHRRSTRSTSARSSRAPAIAATSRSA